MFGIGLGEILLILLIIFIIAPKDLPKIIKRFFEFMKGVDKLKDEITEMSDDVNEILKDAEIPKEMIDLNAKRLNKKFKIKKKDPL